MPELVYVNAGNDSSGNPRRGWIVYEGGEILGFIDEGYKGNGAIKDAGYVPSEIDPSWYPLRITAGQYNDLKKARDQNGNAEVSNR